GIESLTVQTISYRAFKEALADGRISDLRIGPEVIEGQLRVADGEDAEAETPPTPAQRPETEPFGTGAPAPAETAAGGPATVPFRTVRVEDPDLLAAVEAAGVDYTGVQPSMLPSLLIWLLPLGLLMFLWIGIFRRMAGGAGGASSALLSFGKSRARMIADREVGVTFDDVAGCDEAKAELREIVEFLRNPERFTSL